MQVAPVCDLSSEGGHTRVFSTETNTGIAWPQALALNSTRGRNRSVVGMTCHNMNAETYAACACSSRRAQQGPKYCKDRPSRDKQSVEGNVLNAAQLQGLLSNAQRVWKIPEGCPQVPFRQLRASGLAREGCPALPSRA